MKSEYKAYGLNKAKAQRYGEALGRIAEKKGEITPKDVVHDAQKSTSPLHDFFEWDNRKAGDAYRLQQASFLLRNIDIIIVNGEEKPVRAFFNVKVQECEGDAVRSIYVSHERAFTDREMREQVIEYALHELDGWRKRYQQYTELGELFGAIDRFKKKKKS